jgi:hypothetical protein
MQVQTRSSCGMLNFFNSVRDAHHAYELDNTIWKISWDGNRFYTKTKNFIELSPKKINDNIFRDDTNYELEESRLCNLSESYAQCTDPTIIFWVNEPLVLVSDYASLNIRRHHIENNDYWPEHKLRYKLEEIDKEINLKFPDGFCKENTIIEVLTDDQFKNKYC